MARDYDRDMRTAEQTTHTHTRAGEMFQDAPGANPKRRARILAHAGTPRSDGATHYVHLCIYYRFGATIRRVELASSLAEAREIAAAHVAMGAS